MELLCPVPGSQVGTMKEEEVEKGRDHEWSRNSPGRAKMASKLGHMAGK